MIKIRVSSEKMKEIEEKHWKWFEKEFNDDFFDKKIVEENKDELKNIIRYFKKNKEKIIKSKDIENIITEIEKDNFNFFKELIYKRIHLKLNKVFRDKLTEIKPLDGFTKEKELKKIKKIMKEYIEEQEIKYPNMIKMDKNKIEKIKVNQKITNFNEICKLYSKILSEDYKEFIKKIKEKIFCYNKLVTGNREWSRHKLLTELGIQVCPYCNRQYISSFEDSEDEEKTTADLDHFYIKDNYPYLALSLYNFIPSCQICNSRLKGTKDFVVQPVLYPYNENEEFGEKAKFTIELNNKDDFNINKKYNPDVLNGMGNDFFIDIKFDENGEFAEKIKNSIEIFKLKKVYQSHKDYIRELIRKAIIYNESRIDELFREYEGSLFNSREEVVSMIVSNYIDDEDLDKRVLAKLTKDISEELGLK